MKSETNLIDEYNKIKSVLQKVGFEASEYKLINYGLQFEVLSAQKTGVIRLFQNKKGNIKFDFSQLRDNQLLSKLEAQFSQNQPSSTAKKSPPSIINYEPPIIGTDESGKGDYFGPLVAAGVYVNDKTSKTLELLGVKDSKKISDKKALSLAEDIVRVCDGQYSIIEIAPETYNKLFEQFKSEGKNLNVLLAWGHAKALEEILTKVDCERALADQFADEKFILNKLQEKGKKLNLIQIPKAEQNIAVAAASILARARFLGKLKKLSIDFGIELPKGASPLVIEAAKKIVARHGHDALRKVAKLHFKTTKQVLGN